MIVVLEEKKCKKINIVEDLQCAEEIIRQENKGKNAAGVMKGK
jgi:hypothetical protein